MKLGDPTTVSVLASNDRNTSVECEADPPDTICNSVNKVCLLVVQGKGLVELNTDKQPLLLQAHQDLLQLPQWQWPTWLPSLSPGLLHGHTLSPTTLWPCSTSHQTRSLIRQQLTNDMCSQTNKEEVSVMSWCSQWRLRLMWVVLDPVQTLLVDSLKVHVNQINNQDLMYYFILYTGFMGFDSELVVTENNNILNVSYKVCWITDHLWYLWFYMIQCPEICQYESLTYMYSISFTSNQTEGPMTISQSVNTCTNFTSQIEPSNIVEQCNISLVIVNEANERHTLERIFSEYTLPLSINSFTPVQYHLPSVVLLAVLKLLLAVLKLLLAVLKLLFHQWLSHPLLQQQVMPSVWWVQITDSIALSCRAAKSSTDNRRDGSRYRAGHST